MSCPFTCEFLQEARKHEPGPPIDPANLPNRDIHITEEKIEENQELVTFIGRRVLEASLAVPGVADQDVREALDALIRTWRTTQSGIYYESLPQNRLALQVYRAVAQSLEDLRREQSQAGISRVRTGSVLLALAFLQRLELDRNNGRARGRAFLNLLWDFYGEPPAAAASPSSLILP